MSKFSIGRLVATKTIAARMNADKVFGEFVSDSLKRYLNCDWGDLAEDDKKMNDEAVRTGESRILAAYLIPGSEEKIWIITEWDRSCTTVLYPSEY